MIHEESNKVRMEDRPKPSPNILQELADLYSWKFGHRHKLASHKGKVIKVYMGGMFKQDPIYQFLNVPDYGVTSTTYTLSATTGRIDFDPEMMVATQGIFTWGHTVSPSVWQAPRYEPDVGLYKAELKRVREEHHAEESRKREQRLAATSYLEESMALAEPISFELLGWLYYDGDLPLTNVLEAYDDSVNAFECIARLHFIGAVRFDNGKLSITSLGHRILKEFKLIEDDTNI